MNRLVREHFGPRGKPKRRFATAEEAWDFRRKRNGLKKKHAYRCTVCGGWHLGSTAKAVGRQLARRGKVVQITPGQVDAMRRRAAHG